MIYIFAKKRFDLTKEIFLGFDELPNLCYNLT